MAAPSTRKTGAQRRDEIARTALRIIGTRGLGALTTTAVAEEIGVTSGALFRHFASREEILEEAVRIAAAEVDATLPDAALPPLDRLRALARARVRLLRREPGIAWLLRSEQALLALPPVAVRRLRALVRRSRAFIRAAIDDAISAGDLRADVAPDVLLLVFTSTVHALVRQAGLQGRGARGARLDQAIGGLLTLLAAAPARTKRR
jgi:TetR/AcrR family transcriptional regulator